MELLLLLRFAIIVIESLVITALSGTVLLHLQQARCQHLRKAQHKQEKYLRIIYLQRRLQTNPELTSATDATKTADFHTFIRAISAEFRRRPVCSGPITQKRVLLICVRSSFSLLNRVTILRNMREGAMFPFAPARATTIKRKA
jgi:hypothetical protein